MARSTGDLRARAANLFRGAHPLARPSDGTCPINLLSHYVAGESLDSPDVREQLSAGIRRALAVAARETEPSGPTSDARTFYRTAAEILQDIAAAAAAGVAEPAATADHSDTAGAQGP
jgi:hypothetical protein